jgi:hypothetical protein
LARSVERFGAGSCTGLELPIPITARPVSGSPAGPAPSHIRLTDCADGGGLEALPWDCCRRQRRRRDLLGGSPPTGGQGVAGSNPVVPTARWGVFPGQGLDSRKWIKALIRVRDGSSHMDSPSLPRRAP